MVVINKALTGSDPEKDPVGEVGIISASQDPIPKSGRSAFSSFKMMASQCSKNSAQ